MRGDQLCLLPPSVRFTDEFIQSALEGYIGLAIAGGAAAVGAVLIAGLVRRATRK